MPVTHFLQKTEKLALNCYHEPHDINELMVNHVPFTGALFKHPHDTEKIVLVPDPFSPNTSYYEFRSSDVCFAEEMPNIVGVSGEVIPIARIWVKKKSIGIRCSPFVVEDVFQGMRGL